MRRRVLRLEQMLGDALAARRHLLARLALAGWRRPPAARRLRRRRVRPAPAARLRRRRLRGATRLSPRCSITSGLLTTPPRPVPCTRREIDSLLGGDALRGGRRAHLGRPGGGGSRLWRGGGAASPVPSDAAQPALALRVGFAASPRPAVPPRRRRSLIDLGEHIVDLHDVAFGVRALRQHAGGHRGNLDGDLVGLQLDERVAGRDRVALLLQPARDRRFDDRFTERRNFDGGHSTRSGRNG